MLPKPLRLTGRDIQYMVRRGHKTRGKVFGVITIPQHHRKDYHQRSIQISVKVDKRATMRNELKRIARSVFEEKLGEYEGKYSKKLKRFVFINKKSIDQWSQVLMKMSKSDRKKHWKSYCEKDFSRIVSGCLTNLGSKKPFTPSNRDGKRGGQRR